MKRSLLVGLSLSFVLFTMAASITSTVAWFSSTRVAYTSAGNFEVVQVDGSLDCDLAAGVGTMIDSDTNQVLIKSDEEGVAHALSDGSVDLNTGHAYRRSKDTPGYTDWGLPDSDNWVVKTTTEDEVTVKNFIAVSWTMTFKYTFRTETADLGVYLNLDLSMIAARETPKQEAESGKTVKSQIGFRIAMISDAGKSLVFGNNPASDVTTLKYVSGTAVDDVSNYTSSNYVQHDDDYVLIQNGPGHTLAPERICTLSRSHASCVITCIAWFEGEDPNVIDGTQMDIMTSRLTFYARNDA